MTTRRTFLKAAAGSSALLAFGSQVPNCWLQASTQRRRDDHDRVLVVIQLSGGNDGINTLVPVEDDEYYRRRFTLALGKDSVHKVDDYCGLHPAMDGVSELMKDGLAAVIPGVGYPNPNRSHFESMDLWHTAHRKTEQISTGWIGRYLDRSTRDGEMPAMHLGSEDQPLALAAEGVQVPTMSSVEAFRLRSRNDVELTSVIQSGLEIERPQRNDLLRHIQDSSQAAITTSQRVEQAVGNYQSSVDYPQSTLGRKLRSIAQLIDAGLGTRVYYVTLDGFDTHSNQGDAHYGLLSDLSNSMTAFVRDLESQKHLPRVMTMVFSEFGRRVKENASRGTDHGAAAPLFLAGGNVESGLHGTYPSLTDLEDGDLKFTVDYRTIYASILERWLMTESESILGEQFEKHAVIPA